MLYEKKKSIIENDVVLVNIENQPAFFARVEKIIADIKPGWWQVTFLVLQIPLFTITWILDDEQVRGADFTIEGTPIRIEKVVAPTRQEIQEPTSEETTQKHPGKASIISLNSKKGS